MTRRKSNAVVLGAGRTIRLMREGTFLAYWRPSRSSSMERRRFPSFEAARAWLEGKAGAGPMPPLTPAQYVEAQVALTALPPGVSLMDCVRTYGRAVAAAREGSSRTLASVVPAFLDERARTVTDATLRAYRGSLRRFAAFMGEGAALSDCTTERVSAFVSTYEDGVTRNSVLTYLSPIFAWAVRRGWLQINPVSGVQRSRRVEHLIETLTVEEAEGLLRFAEEKAPYVCAYLAVGLFAGVRPEEMLRLRPEDFRNGYILLDGRKTKTADARTIDLRANLAAWLDAYPWPSRGYGLRQPKAMRRVHASLGRPWPHDVLRHTFATYAYEQCRNASAVAAEMGHVGTNIFFRHYRALARPGDGARFFAILPRDRPTGGG